MSPLIRSFALVLAIDPRSGSLVKGFGKGGVQTVGNAIAPTSPALDSLSMEDSVEPHGVAVSGSTIYVYGESRGTSAGIGGVGLVRGGNLSNPPGFIAAIDVRSGVAANGFGMDGLVVMSGRTIGIGDVAVSEGTLFATGGMGRTVRGKSLSISA